MSYKIKSPADAPQRTPYQLARFLFLAMIVAWTALRVLLIWRFVPPPLLALENGRMILEGLLRDSFVALLLIVPVLAWFLIVPQRWYIERWQRFFFWTAVMIVALAHAVFMGAEYFYFAEFGHRPDDLAVHFARNSELVRLLWPESAVWWLAGCAVVSIMFVMLAKRLFTSMWLVTASPFKRLGWFFFALAAAGGLAYWIHIRGPMISGDPAVIEIADNGLMKLAHTIHAGAMERTNADPHFVKRELQPDPPLAVTGTVIKHDGFKSKLVEARNVHVWLPPSYEKEPERRYPVLYANDGQNQFDPKLSFVGADWALDETMTRLIEEGKVREAIIVAVWNTPKRAHEYVPQRAVLSAIGTHREAAMRKIGAEFKIKLESPDWRLSDAYLNFLTEELKPFVDREYRTLTNRANTFIIGSSAGAMISLCAVSEHPDVFGGAACVSTHWPMGDGVLVEYFRNKLPDPATHRIYFDFGTETLDKNYEPYQLKMDAAMARRGYQSGTNWLTCKFQGAEHSEKDWRKRVHVPLEFLLRR